jgi:hypothetical protein
MGIKQGSGFWNIMVGVEILNGLKDIEGRGLKIKYIKIYIRGFKPSDAYCNNIHPQPSGECKRKKFTLAPFHILQLASLICICMCSYSSIRIHTAHKRARYKNENGPKELALYFYIHFYTAEVQLRHHITTAEFYGLFCDAVNI